MNRFTLILFIILFITDNIDAQWYYRKCGLTDINDCSTSREYYCLLDNVEATVKTGKILLTSSVIFIIPGFITMYSQELNKTIGATFLLSTEDAPKIPDIISPKFLYELLKPNLKSLYYENGDRMICLGIDPTDFSRTTCVFRLWGAHVSIFSFLSGD